MILVLAIVQGYITTLNVQMARFSTGKEHRWRCDVHRFRWRIKEGRIVFKKNRQGEWEVYYKQYINEKKEQIIMDTHNNLLSYGKIPDSLLLKVALTGDGAKDIKELFEEKRIFSYPKPKDLLKHLLTISTKNDDLILDFFAGSCPISQAIFELNIEDGGSRRFICVQLPEPTDSNSEAFLEGYKSIAEIGKERIRRVIKKFEKEKVQNGDMFTKNNFKFPLGFKVFKLTQSNFSLWNASVEKTLDVISKQLELHINHISDSPPQEFILYELLLKSGFELSTKIEKIVIENKDIFKIGEGELLVCLEKELTHELIKKIAELNPVRVICLDESFQNNDQLKTNAALIMKSKGVVKFQTV